LSKLYESLSSTNIRLTIYSRIKVEKLDKTQKIQMRQCLHKIVYIRKSLCNLTHINVQQIENNTKHNSISVIEIEMIQKDGCVGDI
jgi:hypothetical protein